MNDKEMIAELERLLKVACYERDGLQKRLDKIRANKDLLVRLLDTPTLQEHLDAGGDIMKVAGKGL